MAFVVMERGTQKLSTTMEPVSSRHSVWIAPVELTFYIPLRLPGSSESHTVWTLSNESNEIAVHWGHTSLGWRRAWLILLSFGLLAWLFAAEPLRIFPLVWSKTLTTNSKVAPSLRLKVQLAI